MIGKLFNPFLSFGARIVIFVVTIMLLTMAGLYQTNRHLEKRLTNLVAEHIKAISVSVDLAQSSFATGKYLDELIQQDGRLSVGLDESHMIHRIVIADDSGRIIDSADRSDIDKSLYAVLGDLSKPSQGKSQADISGPEPEQVLAYPVETDKGKRQVIFIVSPHRLGEIVREVSRERLLAIAILSLVLILLIAFISWRFTQPIRKLTGAALRVSKGEFDFAVPVKGYDEMGALARTFNDMLAGLRSKQELEEKLRRAERSAFTGRVAAGIAHEIRNPLSFINLTIDYLRDKYQPVTEAARTEYTRLCDSVKEEIARLNKMVGDFLSYGRPARLTLREVDARVLIEEVMNLVRAKAEQQGVTLAIKEKPSDDGRSYGTKLQGDAEQLKTCFSNLVINAVQAMDDGGTLTITLHPLPQNVRFEVVDNGSGIAPDALAQIFEPYFSTKETGIGLGLPLTKKLIEDHGGQIMVKSEVGVGTTFTVILPRANALSQEFPALPQPAPSLP